MATEGQNSGIRIGVPSIASRTIPWFFGIFSVSAISLTTIGTWSAVTVGDVGTWHEITRVAMDQATRAAAASIAGAAIVVEGADMVIGAMIRQRAREKGREEGRHEIHQLWMEWNQRRIHAAERGEPFTEPPPRTNGQNPTS